MSISNLLAHKAEAELVSASVEFTAGDGAKIDLKVVVSDQVDPKEGTAPGSLVEAITPLDVAGLGQQERAAMRFDLSTYDEDLTIRIGDSVCANDTVNLTGVYTADFDPDTNIWTLTYYGADDGLHTVSLNAGDANVETYFAPPPQSVLDGLRDTRSCAVVAETVSQNGNNSIPNDRPRGTLTDQAGSETQVPMMSDPVCFARGTRIETQDGIVLIEDLKVGDLVRTLDHGAQPIRWIGSTTTTTQQGRGRIGAASVSLKNTGALRVSTQDRLPMSDRKKQLACDCLVARDRRH